MLAPFASSTFQSAVPIAVFVASVMGSSHCVAMCGGLVAASTRTRREWMSYQLGRLLGYLFFGALSGFIGAYVFGSGHLRELNSLSLIAAAMIAFFFIVAGIRVFRGRSPHFSFIPNTTLSWLFKMTGKNTTLMGLLTSFLPCGWLQSFVLAAAATQSAFRGAIVLFVFWLGTLPALGIAPFVFREIVKPFVFRSSKVAGVIMVLLGFFSVGVRAWPSFSRMQKAPIPAAASSGASDELRCH